MNYRTSTVLRYTVVIILSYYYCSCQTLTQPSTCEIRNQHSLAQVMCFLWCFYLPFWLQTVALILHSYMTHCVQEQVVSVNRCATCMYNGEVQAHISPICLVYLIPFSEILHIQAALHDDPRHVPSQDQRELVAWLLDIQRVSLHRQRCSTIATWREESFWLQPNMRE